MLPPMGVQYRFQKNPSNLLRNIPPPNTSPLYHQNTTWRFSAEQHSSHNFFCVVHRKVVKVKEFFFTKETITKQKEKQQKKDPSANLCTHKPCYWSIIDVSTVLSASQMYTEENSKKQSTDQLKGIPSQYQCNIIWMSKKYDSTWVMYTNGYYSICAAMDV